MPGLPREEILDAYVCDKWKKKNYPQYLEGLLCGIFRRLAPMERRP